MVAFIERSFGKMVHKNQSEREEKERPCLKHRTLGTGSRLPLRYVRTQAIASLRIYISKFNNYYVRRLLLTYSTLQNVHTHHPLLLTGIHLAL